MSRNTFKAKPKEIKSTKLNFSFFSDRKFQVTFGLAMFLTAVFLLFSFVSYLNTGKADQSIVEAFARTDINSSGQEVQNWFGLIGAVTAHYFIFHWFGIIALIIPFFLLNASSKVLYNHQLFNINKSFIFSVFYLIWTSMLMGYIVINTDEVSLLGFLCGGVGYELAVLFESLMGWGTSLFILFLFVTFNMYFFNITRVPGFDNLGTWIEDIQKRFAKSSPQVDQDLSSVIAKVKEEVALEDFAENDIKMETDEAEFSDWDPDEKKENDLNHALEDDLDPLPPETELELAVDTTKTIIKAVDKDDLDMEVEKPATQEIVTDQLENYDPTLDLPHYKYPTPDLLIQHPENTAKVTKEELESNKDKILHTLINFKIGITSIKATIGPTVTLYEIVPEAGIKISKIKNLEDDIALSLAALGIRIIAPIPGRGTIGIEVPNKNREMVDARSIISTEKFLKSTMELPVVLGKTISNELFVTDLAKMPHLLMAGATGQGKSVGLNIILASLIYKKHPSQLKFVLVDPKKVELTLFNKLERHFLAKLPDSEEAIITDITKVVHTLNSLCIEMDTRYDMLKDAGCRNLKEYNKKFVNRRLNPNKGHKYLPYIVLVIDELADLMMTAGKEVEMPIARLAQLARAIGIHLIVATQRPSVNVITGIIKANFPARLSFRVTSKIDSRTILDAGGAEQLIGMGDMLLSMGSQMTRLQCGFVDTPEIEDLCEFIGDQKGYESAYLLPEYVGEEDNGIGAVDLSDRDALFEDAARLIVAHQQGSTSLIQRKMKLGYNRAGRIIDQLEAAGIVGAFEGSKAREVLIKDDYSLEQMLNDIDNN
jgi:S-DNA-T family DNA segregation ATPase FtsK/SpoIIIE